MKVDRRFHCFGCQADGDVIDFVSRLENISPKEAALMLAQDFSIPYEDKEPPGRSRRPQPRQESPEQQFKRMERHCFRVLSDYHNLLRRWKRDYAPKTPDVYKRQQLPLCGLAARKHLALQAVPVQQVYNSSIPKGG